MFDAKKIIYLKTEERRIKVVVEEEEKEEEEEEEEEERKNIKQMTVWMHQKTVHLSQEFKKHFPFGRFQFSVPPLPSGKGRELVSEEEKLFKFYLKV